MPYGFVLVIAVLVLAVRHIRSTYASSRSKLLVAGLTAFGVLAPYLWSGFLPFAGLVSLTCPVIQLAVGFYLAFHEAVWRPDAENVQRPSIHQKKSPDQSNVADQ
jgi:hypothetical protein